MKIVNSLSINHCRVLNKSLIYSSHNTWHFFTYESCCLTKINSYSLISVLQRMVISVKTCNVVNLYSGWWWIFVVFNADFNFDSTEMVKH